MGECYVGGGKVSGIWELLLQTAMSADCVLVPLKQIRFCSHETPEFLWLPRKKLDLESIFIKFLRSHKSKDTMCCDIFAPAYLKNIFHFIRLVKGTVPQEIRLFTSKDQILNDQLVSTLIATQVHTSEVVFLIQTLLIRACSRDCESILKSFYLSAEV